MSAHRIVSLLPSTTEIACALGFEGELVGRSHECDYPPSVVGLPVCTAPKFDVEGSSRQIDERVKDLVRRGLSVYDVDADKLRELAPTAILTQDQCHVCAASLDDVERALRDWLGAQPALVSLNPQTLGDAWGDLVRVGEALGEAERARRLSEQLADRLSQITEQVMRIKARPSVACVEWIDPLMAAGNWVPELVALAGGRNLFGETGAHSAWLSWEELRAADPDVIAVMPCGFGIARSRAELDALRSRPGWKELRAVRDGRVYLTDGNQYFNRPGPRLVESLEILAELLHPETLRFGHRGSGWEPV